MSIGNVITNNSTDSKSIFETGEKTAKFEKFSDLEVIRRLSDYSYKGLKYPVKAPQSDAFELIEKKCQLWVKSHPEPLQEIAKKYLLAIRRVSHDEFLTQLGHSALNYQEHLTEKPINKRNYIIVIPRREYKSFQWVTALALPFLSLVPPDDIYCLYNQQGKLVEDHQYVKIHSDKRFLFIDDASYSGDQICEYVKEIQALFGEKAQIDLMIPFMTDRSVERVREICPHVCILKHEKIPSIYEMGFFNYDSGRVVLLDKRRTLTFFNHKMPDHRSIPINVLKGQRMADDNFFPDDDTDIGGFLYKQSKTPYEEQ